MGTRRLFEAKIGRIRAVKVGFNWFACILGCLWAFANGGWILGLLMFAGSLFTVGFEVRLRTTIGGVVAELGSLALYVGYMYACGRYGNEWLARTLTGQGYREVQDHLH